MFFLIYSHVIIIYVHNLLIRPTPLEENFERPMYGTTFVSSTWPLTDNDAHLSIRFHFEAHLNRRGFPMVLKRHDETLFFFSEFIRAIHHLVSQLGELFFPSSDTLRGSYDKDIFHAGQRALRMGMKVSTCVSFIVGTTLNWRSTKFFMVYWRVIIFSEAFYLFIYLFIFIFTLISASAKNSN